MKKIAIFAFKGDPMCFAHVLLNALDLYSKNVDVKIIIEGEATRLVPEMEKNDHFLHDLYVKSKKNGLIHKVCRACSSKMGALQAVISSGLSIGDDMSGHPGFFQYINENFEIITM